MSAACLHDLRTYPARASFLVVVAMTDNTSTMAVGKLAAKLKARRVLASDEDGHTMTYSSGDPELVKAAALLDALARERDGWKRDFEIARDKLVAEYDRAESAEREIIALRRERDEARRMREQSDKVIAGTLSLCDGMTQDEWMNWCTEAYERHRASEAGKETKGG